jgi:acyl-CoA synthetase (AMP-forming)/AMP-acid ligase II
LINRLLNIAQSRPRAPFVLYQDDVWDFGSFGDLALRGCNWMAALGIEVGDRVVIAVGNRPLFLFYWFSLAARGAVAVPVAHDLFGDSLRYVVRQSGAKQVLAEYEECARISDELSDLAIGVHALRDEADFVATVANFPLAPAQGREDGVPVAILYTSGTTGLPKGAVIPNRSYLAIGEKITEAIGIGAGDRILTFLPLHHANPQMYAVMSALTVGCSIILVPKFSASSFLEQVRRYGATGFTYVGTVLSILEQSVRESVTGTSLRWCVGGGAPRAVWEALASRLGVRIHELYGMTETGGMVTINSLNRSRVGSVGVVRNDFDVVVLAADDSEVPTGTVGEIAVRPRLPHVMTSGYFNKPQETLDAIRNLWFHTGDLGRFDAEGFLNFEGRSKDLIRRGGEMISPVEIELAALKHPNIADCAAVGIADPILEEEIKLVVVARDKCDPQEIASFLRRALPRNKVPRYIEFSDVIPKTPTQKIQRFKLTKLSPQSIDLRPAAKLPD